VKPGEYPRLHSVVYSNPFSGRGIMPLPDRLLTFVYLVDMFAEGIGRRWFLDRISAMGLLRSKWYATEALATFNQENLLKAVAVPAYELSAYTGRLVGVLFASNPVPFMSFLRGDLQTTWIEPFGARLRAMGATIHLGRRVTRLDLAGGRVTGVQAVDTATGTTHTHTGDHYLWATNLEVLRRDFLNDALYQADPQLGRVHQLDSAPMTALHLYLNRRLPGLPREHLFLSGGKYALSCIDVSQHWSGVGNTALSFIASDFRALERLPEAVQKQALLDEIMQYLPIAPTHIEQAVLQPNVQTPLFMNTVTAWSDRPNPVTQVANLRIAGDWVRHQVDLACMEGAISAAQTAAGSILDELGVPHLPMPKKPRQVPRWVWRLAELAMKPWIPPIYAWAWLNEKSGGRLSP